MRWSERGRKGQREDVDIDIDMDSQLSEMISVGFDIWLCGEWFQGLSGAVVNFERESII